MTVLQIDFKKKFEKVDLRFKTLEKKVDTLALYLARFKREVNVRFEKIETRLDSLEDKLNTLDIKIDKILINQDWLITQYKKQNDEHIYLTEIIAPHDKILFPTPN